MWTQQGFLFILIKPEFCVLSLYLYNGLILLLAGSKVMYFNRLDADVLLLAKDFTTMSQYKMSEFLITKPVTLFLSPAYDAIF